jgi:hypothetical protein
MTSLVPEAYYWARPLRQSKRNPIIVQVSTVFGAEPDYWTLAVPGSDQHHMITDFQLIELIQPPTLEISRQAAE